MIKPENEKEPNWTVEDYEIDNLNYEIVIFQAEIAREQAEIYSNKLRYLFEGYPDTLKINNSTKRFECLIDASRLLANLGNLPDSRRLLFSDDRRTLVDLTADDDDDDFKLGGHRFELNSMPRRFSIDPTRWEHDVSFWCQAGESFDHVRFVSTIRQTCYGLVRHVRLLDRFDDGSRHSYCFRLVYESCDRALDWNTTRIVQERLRERLCLENRFVMR